MVRDAVTYLVCTLWDYHDPIQLALHRIRTAEPLDTQARRPSGFDLDTYIRQGAFFRPFSDQPIRLEALFDADVAYTTSKSQTQRGPGARRPAHGRVLVKATVQDTGELRWWVRGLGEGVEVIQPFALRHPLNTSVT